MAFLRFSALTTHRLALKLNIKLQKRRYSILKIGESMKAKLKSIASVQMGHSFSHKIGSRPGRQRRSYSNEGSY